MFFNDVLNDDLIFLSGWCPIFILLEPKKEKVSFYLEVPKLTLCFNFYKLNFI